MTAELLREAAAKMRARAEAAVNGDLAPICWDECHQLVGGEKSHYSSWHPAVALAVADSLDESAREWGVLAEVGDVPCEHPCCSGLRRALAVARAYLGTPTPTTKENP